MKRYILLLIVLATTYNLMAQGPSPSVTIYVPKPSVYLAQLDSATCEGDSIRMSVKISEQQTFKMPLFGWIVSLSHDCGVTTIDLPVANLSAPGDVPTGIDTIKFSPVAGMNVTYKVTNIRTLYTKNAPTYCENVPSNPEAHKVLDVFSHPDAIVDKKVPPVCVGNVVTLTIRLKQGDNQKWSFKYKIGDKIRESKNPITTSTYQIKHGPLTGNAKFKIIQVTSHGCITNYDYQK
jgi:hypothetical protein